MRYETQSIRQSSGPSSRRESVQSRAPSRPTDTPAHTQERSRRTSYQDPPSPIVFNSPSRTDSHAIVVNVSASSQGSDIGNEKDEPSLHVRPYEIELASEDDAVSGSLRWAKDSDHGSIAKGAYDYTVGEDDPGSYAFPPYPRIRRSPSGRAFFPFLRPRFPSFRTDVNHDVVRSTVARRAARPGSSPGEPCLVSNPLLFNPNNSSYIHTNRHILPKVGAHASRDAARCPAVCELDSELDGLLIRWPSIFPPLVFLTHFCNVHQSRACACRSSDFRRARPRGFAARSGILCICKLTLRHRSTLLCSQTCSRPLIVADATDMSAPLAPSLTSLVDCSAHVAVGSSVITFSPQTRGCTWRNEQMASHLCNSYAWDGTRQRHRSLEKFTRNHAS